MAKKARKKSAAKKPSKASTKKAAVKKKTKAAAKKKKKRKTPAKTFKEKVTGAYRTVIDSIKDADRLRNKLEQPGTSESE